MIRAAAWQNPRTWQDSESRQRRSARLKHPNIVQIFDIGEAGGLPFVALELLEGGSLDTFLGGTPQPGEACRTVVGHAGESDSRGSSSRHHPSRLEAGQHHVRDRRNGEDYRFRSCQATRSRRIHRDRAGVGLAELHSAGAGTRAGQGGRPDGRCIRARGDPVRNVDRPAPIQGQDVGGNGDTGPQR